MSIYDDAKKALDTVLNKSRVHLYKPIQIAEILYHDRIYKDINLLNLEDYRNKSKKWRDDICIQLLGRVCTSSAKFQDNLFETNALPSKFINALGIKNRETHGAIEAYIYNKFIAKHCQLSSALSYCIDSTISTFDVKHLIDSFWCEPGLKRSLDKIYEIIVYALFATLVEILEFKVQVHVEKKHLDLLDDFSEFAQKVMCIDFQNPQYIQDARVYRVGVTNAADRGLDMYSNWGPAIQIKHLSLDVELAENIVNSVSSDRIVIVCKNAEKDVILSLLTQIGWKSKIQSIITENNLINWYEKALRGKFAKIIGQKLLDRLRDEIINEFPPINNIPDVIKNRHYDKISIEML